MNIEIKGFSEQNNGIMELPQQNIKKFSWRPDQKKKLGAWEEAAKLRYVELIIHIMILF